MMTQIPKIIRGVTCLQYDDTDINDNKRSDLPAV